MLRSAIILAVFLFHATAVLAEQDKYYGFQGSCNDAIYQFDFKAGKFTLFGVYRLKINNSPQYQYYTSRGKLAKLADSKFLMEPGNGKPTAIISVATDGSINGQTSDKSTFYFGICDPQQALTFIKDVMSHTK